MPPTAPSVPPTRPNQAGETPTGIDVPPIIQASLEQLLDSNPVPTFVLNADHVITHWNHACELIIGTPASAMIGTQNQWKAFYQEPRPVLADLIIEDKGHELFARYYDGKYRYSKIVPNAIEAEDYFPNFPGGGRWLFFTATPLQDNKGAIVGAIETLQDITERKIAEQDLAQVKIDKQERETLLLSAIDILKNQRSKAHGALIFLDMDRFKQLNEQYGHAMGDVLLMHVSERLLKCVRSQDTVARLGGDEFIVILENLAEAPETALLDATRVCQVILERLNQAYQLREDLSYASTPSIGLTLFNGTGDDVNAVLKRADAAMYQAKEAGKNTIRIHNPPPSRQPG